ncbi:MAG: FtsB family cell division protein [Alphaproteobacteria bacterium]
MTKLSTALHLFKRNLPIFIGLSLCIYFSYHTIAGERNYGRLLSLQKTASEKEQSLAGIQAQRDALENKVAMLRPDSISADMLEEQVRVMLGYKHKDEISVIKVSDAE